MRKTKCFSFFIIKNDKVRMTYLGHRSWINNFFSKMKVLMKVQKKLEDILL